ncbi:MAG: DUF5696 domain-containing protein [Lachnospiraceae bacterium]|nr:DUF5696 domain-containing protein [Lachnospiraceae bacterium]
MENYLRVSVDTVELGFDCEKTLYTISASGHTWEQGADGAPAICRKDGRELLFSGADRSRHRYEKRGVGEGIFSCYEWSDFSVETYVWVEYATHAVHFELIPGKEMTKFVKVRWPGAFSGRDSNGNTVHSYTALPLQQGVLIPDDWEQEVRKLPFGGQFCSAAAYMPWFGQVKDGHGYIAICETPWDAGYEVDHPAGGPHTRVEPYFLPSLGELSYRRCMRYVFQENCDYNDLCKIYRSYVRETGLFTTLREKAARNPRVDELIGSVIVHKGIKTHVSPDSAFYDPEHPEKNDVLIPFSARSREIRRYHEMGVRRLYLHLDGWGAPGYDNRHPDYLPACPEAGGWEGLKELSDTIQDCGYLFGLHDQYRDYYTDAASYDQEYAVRDADGGVFEMARWAGGRQNYLCATQAPYYVKRNFEEVLSHGIRLQASYLDVFTCNEPDECSHPHHRMTRKECLEYREACFAYLTSKGILPSSEECGDWAMRELVFCHYGPYDFMLEKPGSPRRGIPVPLFNLVYHDCMILPWFMDRQEGNADNEHRTDNEKTADNEDSGDSENRADGEDYMLYALLNGGAPYLDRDGAYPDTDGAFDSAARRRLAEDIARCAQVTALQERVAKCEMVRHEFPDGNPKHQRTVFSDGTQVTVWLDTGKYEICYPIASDVLKVSGRSELHEA